MAHFARVNKGIVEEVLVGEQDFFDNLIYDKPGIWVQTSYNTRRGQYWNSDTGELHEDQSRAFRGNYATIGMEWHPDKGTDGVFLWPKPYESWTLNETNWQWEAPITYPTSGGSGPDGNTFRWDEEAYQADTNDPKTAGWVDSY